MKKLAKITKASLEIQERGILNFWIFVDYEDGGSQGIGGIALDTYNDELKTRVGTAYGCEMIRRLLLELRVNDFSAMVEQTIWVLGKGEGFSFSPTGIQGLKNNRGSDFGVTFSQVAKDMDKLEMPPMKPGD